jgi:hypothetical protein
MTDDNPKPPLLLSDKDIRPLTRRLALLARVAEEVRSGRVRLEHGDTGSLWEGKGTSATALTYEDSL